MGKFGRNTGEAVNPALSIDVPDPTKVSCLTAIKWKSRPILTPDPSL
jgi:hypothetical protein